MQFILGLWGILTSRIKLVRSFEKIEHQRATEYVLRYRVGVAPSCTLARPLDSRGWAGHRTQLLGRIGEMGRPSPDTLSGYQALSGAGAKTDHLGGKTAELIALAVAVTVRCDGCIAVHSKAALQEGASKEEIAEALGVAVAVNAGAALVFSARVLDSIDGHRT
jgi:AhpD family alkylhydroperoxidase